jgi:hypothetical protein
LVSHTAGCEGEEAVDQVEREGEASGGTDEPESSLRWQNSR